MAVWEYEAAIAEWHLAQASLPGGVVAVADFSAAGSAGDFAAEVDGFACCGLRDSC
jgi:hypothetical protein